MKNELIIICGHYGCGKTNLALNIAVEKTKQGKKTMIVDMDTVNPYFRSGDYKELLDLHDIELIAPRSLGTTLDTPSISAKVYSAFVDSDRTVIIDVGGDDVGATALGSFSEKIEDYSMIYVINQNRPEIKEPINALHILKEIEEKSHLKATAVINNSHLGQKTTKETVIKSFDYAEKFSEIANLPLLYSTAPDFVSCENAKSIKVYVTFPW